MSRLASPVTASDPSSRGAASTGALELQAASVIIPTYNRARLVTRAVESVLAAVDDGDEVIVVDDGSTDDTEKVLAPYAGRIRYLRVENGRAGRARNHGIRAATRPLVAFLDSDDEWMPDRLRLGRRLLAARPDVLFCFSDFVGRRPGVPDRHGAVRAWSHDPRPWDEILGPAAPYATLTEPVAGWERVQVHVGDLYPALLDASYVAVQTLLVRRIEAGDALRFAEDLELFEDWECAARLARAGQAAFLDAETAVQWSHESSRLTDAGELVRAVCHRKLVERLWAADPTFLERHGDRVRATLRALRLQEALGELRRGRTSAAREALDNVAGAPLSYRLLAAMPSAVVLPLIRARLLLKQRLPAGWVP